ncbi:MAG: sulfate ABC transporter permease subunit [Actinomycetota bacterium]
MSTAGQIVLRGGARRRVVRGVLFILALVYVGVLLLAPTLGILFSVVREGWELVSRTFSQADVQNSFKLTATTTLITVVVTAFFGVITAWVLARDHFPGRSLLNAFVDLPMAVSPVIVGLMAVLLFGRGGWFEPFFAARGIQIIFAVPSMVIVTIFISIPFVIREVLPVLQEIGTDEEEAAKTLGASALQSFFRVTLPNIRWALFYGIALSAARAIGEIGAVLIVSGSIQGLNETATMFIFRALEERQDAQAYIVALTLAALSILLLVAIEFFKHRQKKEISR